MLLSWIIAIDSYCVILSQLLYPSLNPGSHLSEKHLLFLLIHFFYTFQIMRGESKFLSEVLKLPNKFFSHYFSCFITYSFLWEQYVLIKTDYCLSPGTFGILYLLISCFTVRLCMISLSLTHNSSAFSTKTLFFVMTLKGAPGNAIKSKLSQEN